MKRTLQDVLRLCEEKEVKIIDFKMTDIDGRWRHLSIPVGRLNEDTMIYGIGFDGSTMAMLPLRTVTWSSSPTWTLPLSTPSLKFLP